MRHHHLVRTRQLPFASETIGAIRSIDPRTGHHFDDTKRYVDAVSSLGESDLRKIFEGNARRVYPRINARPAEAKHA